MSNTPNPITPETQSRQARISLVAVILVLTLVSMMFRALVAHQLEPTSALFIGIPAFLAVLVALTPRAKSATGMIVKVMTLALLMSGILLGEGLVCIIMASPLFYAVGIAIGLIVDAVRRSERKQQKNVLTCVVLLGVLPMSLEGVNERLSFPREERVSVTRVVAAPAADVERALSATPRFDKPLPLYLQMKFPRPAMTSGSGLAPGDERTIHFAGGEGHDHDGDLVMAVNAVAPNEVRFRMVSDTSHITHWLAWREAEVRWRAVDVQHTEVTWTISYRRRLDPAWYFAPWERYAVRLAAGYLIETAATPQQAAALTQR